MFKNELEIKLKKLAGIFTLEQYAHKMRQKGKFPKLSPKTSIWDALDVFCKTGSEYVWIGRNKYIERAVALKIRIPLFLLLAEFESRLFRIHEWNGKDISALNEKYINELIKELVDSDLINLQKVYKSRGEFREDLKAISSFRNIIMHVNKKLERELKIETVFKRKKQVFKLLEALQQILDGVKHAKAPRN